MELRGVEKLVARHAGLQQELEIEVFQAMRDHAQEVAREARLNAPSFSGGLRRRIRMRSSMKKMTASVKATAPHSWLVEHGRTAGKMPSVDPAHAKRPQSAQDLLNWAKAHNINPFILARAIARKGTQAHPFMKPARIKAGVFEWKIRDVVRRVLAKYAT